MDKAAAADDDRPLMKPTTPSSRVSSKTSTKSAETPVVPELSSAQAFSPSAEDVALHAYFKYENQGSEHGHDVDDWHAAEAELSSASADTQP